MPKASHLYNPIMADVATGNVGDTNPQTSLPGVPPNTIDPNEVLSLNDPI
ncbi:unnamed protein product [Penicillium roqueforti FM164]|uniref:Genomic scaffold, ProqFM164S01 n=1 Tax=Penicillium roqueforti (strain FM164) TaxID=1365484 RepID=W6PQW3_PENRF|nr:unnamed protein product [Penicillium roqueforti FM164]